MRAPSALLLDKASLHLPAAVLLSVALPSAALSLRYADWAKRCHFDGPLLTGSQSRRDRERGIPPPLPPAALVAEAAATAGVAPLAAASAAWRTHPADTAVRAARGVSGRPLHNPSRPRGFTWTEPTVEEVEAEFWRIVEAADEQVEALYGQDIDTALYSSAFPTIRVRVRGVWRGRAGLGRALPIQAAASS